MSRQSAIRDLRAMLRQVEAAKRDIDRQLQAIYLTLRVLEAEDSITDVEEEEEMKR